MAEALSLWNCVWRRGTLSDTLKKSIASQVQARYLTTLRLPARQSGNGNTPRQELGPLDPRNGAQYLEEGSTVDIASFATWDEVADEIRRHVWGCGMRAQNKWSRRTAGGMNSRVGR